MGNVKILSGILAVFLSVLAAKAGNYEAIGTVIINGQTVPFYFRWDDGRWMICEIGDNTSYKKICLSCDGKNLVTYYENKLDQKSPGLVPYQASVKSGVFPGREANFFGAIAAVLEPSLLSEDLNLRACQIVYPSANQDVCDRCVTNYSISLVSPSSLQKVLSVTTDKIATKGTALINGWEILHAEINYDASLPGLVKQFAIKYQNPDFNGGDPGKIQVIYDISGSVSKYQALTADFNGWPPIEGKTAVSDSRVINKTNPFAMTYLTKEHWLTNVDGLPMSEVQSNFLDSVHTYNTRLSNGRGILAVVCVNAVILTILLSRWLAKRKTEIKQ